jgi:hypothetical protein
MGVPVKARLLIANAAFGPDELKKIYAAFDAAWDQLAPHVSSRADAVETARINLANVILGLASRGAIDHARLTNAAVQLILSDPTRRARHAPAVEHHDLPRFLGLNAIVGIVRNHSALLRLVNRSNSKEIQCGD